MAGGKSVFVPLVPPANHGSAAESIKSSYHEWTLDFDALEKAITSKTKILLINSPHNPTGIIILFYSMNVTT